MVKSLHHSGKTEFEIVSSTKTTFLRNDGQRLFPVSENPWYVLATIFGEQDIGSDRQSFNQDLDDKNRRAWNAWACHDLTDAERIEAAQQLRLSPKELDRLKEEEMLEIMHLYQDRIGDSEVALTDPSARIVFSNSIFLAPFGMQNRYFPSRTYFNNCHFEKDAYFSFSQFTQSVDFNSCFFGLDSYFNMGRFKADADFSKSYFSNDAFYISTAFLGAAVFNTARFIGRVTFKAADFNGPVEFSSAKFLGATAFGVAKFRNHVPKFHAARLYADTVFSTDEPASLNWPSVPSGPLISGKASNSMPAEDQKRAYSTLRYFMSQNLEIDQELFFHRREMACKEVTDRKWLNRKLIKLYGYTSDYGSSIAKPLMWLGVNLLFGIVWLSAWLLGKAPDRGVENIAAIGAEAFGWSFSNVFAFFRFGNLFYGKDYYEQLHGLLQFLAASQTVFGFIFIFLLGLGIRSRFRLR